MIPNFVQPRVVSSRYSCIYATKTINGAKASWALENKKMNSDTPTATDLFGPNAFIRDSLECPAGGRYIIGRVDQKPRCSLPMHFLCDSAIEVVDASDSALEGVRIEVQRTNQTLCVLETGGDGHADFFTNSFSVASNWWSATAYLRFSFDGYRTEIVPMPDMWPLRVVLRKEQK